MTRPARHDWECGKYGCVEKRIYVKEAKGGGRFHSIGWIGTKCGQVTLERDADPVAAEVITTLRRAID